jgi:hypothetical protein
MLISAVAKTKLLPYRHFIASFVLFFLALYCYLHSLRSHQVQRIYYVLFVILTEMFGGIVCFVISLLVFKDEKFGVRLTYVG